MHIDIRNLDRQRLFSVEVDLNDPPAVVRPNGDERSSTPTQEVFMNWDRAVDDEGHLRRCPVCGCRDLFVRKDFPQITGLTIVALATIVSMALFGAGAVIAAWGVLAAMVVLDAVIYAFTGKTLVCYRCRSEFRRLPIAREIKAWDLSVGEKYRRLPTDTARRADPHPAPSEPESTSLPR